MAKLVLKWIQRKRASNEYLENVRQIKDPKHPLHNLLAPMKILNGFVPHISHSAKLPVMVMMSHHIVYHINLSMLFMLSA